LSVSFAGGAASTRTDALAAGGTIHQESNSDAGTPVASGWARAQCSGPIKSSVLYRSYQNGIATAEASVPGILPATKFVSFADSVTGIAYANPSTDSAVVTFRALDYSGSIAATASLTVPPSLHGAVFIGELLKLPAFAGSIHVTSTAPIVVLTLNFEAAPVFSSLAPADLDSVTPLAGEK